MDFAPRLMFRIPGTDIPVTETVTTTWLVILVLVLFSVVGVRYLREKPRGVSNVVELIAEMSEWLVDNTMGAGFSGFTPFFGTLSLYLFVANVLGILPWLRSPSADLNTPAALALISFFVIHYYGVREKGLVGYVKSFFAPIPLLFPLNVLGELAFPLSLGFRLFGNMVGAMVIMSLAYSFAPVLFPILPHLYFDLFAGLIQAFIFTMLTMTYLSLAVD